METSCDGRQNNTKCYGPFGGSVVIHLLNDTSTMNEVTWFRNNSKILTRRKGQNLVNKLEGRSVISDETVTLHNLNWDDAGEYKLEILNLTSGKQIGLWILQLMVEGTDCFTLSLHYIHIQCVDKLTPLNDKSQSTFSHFKSSVCSSTSSSLLCLDELTVSVPGREQGLLPLSGRPQSFPV